MLQNLKKTAGMAYAVENYIEIDFGWKLADSNGFLDSKLSVGEQVPSEIDTIENQDKSVNEIISNDESDFSDNDEYKDGI